MALTVTARGTSARNTGSETSYVITPGSNFAAGSMACLAVAYDNSGASGADPFSSVTDSAGNIWWSVTDAVLGTQNAGAAGRILVAHMDVPLTTSHTITVSYGANTTVARAYALWEVSGSTGRPIFNIENAETATSATPTITTASITSGHAVIAAIGREQNSTPSADADTTNGNWSSMQESGVGTTTTGMEIVSQSKVVTGTATQTYNPTFGGTSADGVELWASFMEIPLGVPWRIGSNGASDVAGFAVPMPLGLKLNDILILDIFTANQAITITNSNGGTWTEAADSPQGQGTGGSAGSTRITRFWSRYNGTQGAPTIGDSGNMQQATITNWRGCVTSGDPYDVTVGGTEATSDTSLSVTGDTTTVPNCTVVIGVGLTPQTSAFGATWTNADLANLAEKASELWTSSAGITSRYGLVEGYKVAAGSFTSTTNTLGANASKAFHVMALKPATKSPPFQPSGSLRYRVRR